MLHIINGRHDVQMPIVMASDKLHNYDLNVYTLFLNCKKMAATIIILGFKLQLSWVRKLLTLPLQGKFQDGRHHLILYQN